MPELRQSPASKEWVIIATERAQRPTEFRGEEPLPENEHDKNCPFCPGNEDKTPKEILAYRTYGTKPNTTGWWIRIIPNKFPALVLDGDPHREKIDDFYRHMVGLGEHEVIIESQKHNATIATMDDKQVEEIFLAYRERYITLSKDPRFEMIIIFKNHGKAAGTSVKHPHSQVIATPITPLHVRQRIEEAMRFFDDNGECVYCSMIKKEREMQERIVLETDNFIAFVPYASRSPFETWILPKTHQTSFVYISPEGTKELAYIVKRSLGKIFVGLKNPDYNAVIYSSPCHEKDVEYYHWHMKITPRVAAVAGFEMGSGMYINTVIPENAAEYLRSIKT